MKITLRLSVETSETGEIEKKVEGVTKKVNGSCLAQDCVEILKELKISATVFPTISSVETRGMWASEVGVSMDIYGCKKDDICSRVWPAFQKRFASLECAHVKEGGFAFSGCLHDYQQPSVCPEKQRKEKEKNSCITQTQEQK